MVHITNIGGSLTTACASRSSRGPSACSERAKLADQKTRARVLRENFVRTSMRPINSERVGRPRGCLPRLSRCWWSRDAYVRYSWTSGAPRNWRTLTRRTTASPSAGDGSDTHRGRLAHVLRNKATQWRLRARDGPHGEAVAGHRSHRSVIGKYAERSGGGDHVLGT